MKSYLGKRKENELQKLVFRVYGCCGGGKRERGDRAKARPPSLRLEMVVVADKKNKESEHWLALRVVRVKERGRGGASKAPPCRCWCGYCLHERKTRRTRSIKLLLLIGVVGRRGDDRKERERRFSLRGRSPSRVGSKQQRTNLVLSSSAPRVGSNDREREFTSFPCLRRRGWNPNHRERVHRSELSSAAPRVGSKQRRTS